MVRSNFARLPPWLPTRTSCSKGSVRVWGGWELVSWGGGVWEVVGGVGGEGVGELGVVVECVRLPIAQEEGECGGSAIVQEVGEVFVECVASAIGHEQEGEVVVECVGLLQWGKGVLMVE